jgi:cation diffusion facilitator CzcD-associated flavoprotein CzcO
VTQETNLLIVGAGPFGLSLAAHMTDLGIEHIIIGKAMEFWQANMPEGMYLRSAGDWHLDAAGAATIERFLASQGLTRADVEPLSRRFYLSYARWFLQQKGIAPLPVYLQRLDYDEQAARFHATLDDGRTISARNVVLAVGFKYFANMPAELTALLPAGRFEHTCDLVDFAALRDKRCLILGGRQSAFEWAALLHEAGVAAVDLVYRHPSPAFAEADWSWVSPIVDAMVDAPGWFRNLNKAEQDEVTYRLWAEGRLKVEPWLEKRVLTPGVRLWPGTQVIGCTEPAGGAVAVQLDNGTTLTVDQIILATGYKVRMERLPFLRDGNILPRLATRNGFPVLDEWFQSSVPGLYITSMPANQDFGPFFAFTVSVRASARIIGRALSG